MARRPNGRGYSVRQIRPLPQAEASIDTRDQSRKAQVVQFSGDPEAVAAAGAENSPTWSFDRLVKFANHSGNLCDFLEPGVVGSIGEDAIREWQDDDATRSTWVDLAEKSLDEAAQEDDTPEGETGKSTPWDNASNIKYPILSKATLDWNAKAYPELVKGDQLVKAKCFNQVPESPSPAEAQSAAGPPADPQAAQQEGQAVQGAEQAAKVKKTDDQAREARGKRLAMFINHTIFYQMAGWETETDLLFAQMPPIGQGFKKVYMSPNGVQSDFVSAINLTVDNKRTKNLKSVPRVSHDFEKYPYEIEQMMRMGRWNDVVLTPKGHDKEAPRALLEQLRNEDLDHDGIAEPYIVTVDIDTHQVLCIEAAYTMEDVHTDQTQKPPKVLYFDRWQTYADFKFLPDPRGHFYGMGLGRLLKSITDAVDSSINQMMDGNSAAIAGGGFVGAGVRLGGAGAGGELYYKPGEYQNVSVPGQDIRTAIWERTLPNLGPATMQLLELLLAAAKDLASVKDILSGEGPANTPVGTVMAIQQQAMQAFTAVFKRVCRGFHEEAQMIYACLRRWKRPQDVQSYEDLTGGKWAEDFADDGKDLQLVADPNVVSQLMKMARLNAIKELAESEVGQAAGMTQAGPAQELVKEALDAMGVDRPERFVAQVAPNPEAVAKAADMNAAAQQKTAGAALDTQKAGNLEAEANLDRAKALRELALAHNEGDKLNQAADNLMTHGTVEPPEEQDGAQTSPGGPGSAGPPGAQAPASPA